MLELTVLLADVIQVCVVRTKHALPFACDEADIGGEEKREPPQHCDEHFDVRVLNRRDDLMEYERKSIELKDKRLMLMVFPRNRHRVYQAIRHDVTATYL
jgi:hypothetical protein